jgi:uncharacterized tellurite resistance protein B-like protein
MSLLHYFDHSEKKNKKEYFVHLIQVTLADGKVTQKESEMLHRLGKRLGFTDPEIDELLTKRTQSSYVPPYELTLRFDQLYTVMKISLADGEIDDSVMHLAHIFASTSGFKSSEIPKLLNLLITGIKNGEDEEELLKAYKKLK